MCGINVKLLVHEKVIKEQLSRIGIKNKKFKVFNPTCYLTRDNGDYIIAHFKELFPRLTNGQSSLTSSDFKRRDHIICMLIEWGLIEPIQWFKDPKIKVSIIKKNNKKDWDIRHKINLFNLNHIEAKHLQRKRNINVTT
jgi:hypothetical protein